MSGASRQLRPLIVGVEVEAFIQVESVQKCFTSSDSGNSSSTSSSTSSGTSSSTSSSTSSGTSSSTSSGMDNNNDTVEDAVVAGMLDHSLREKFSQGYELSLKTQVKRINDGEIISNGTQIIWLPDYYGNDDK